MKILLIDNDTFCLRILQNILKPGGHECAAFQNPRKGIESFKKNEYDVVITDFDMPEMNGLEVINEVREHKPGTHFIVISGFDDIADVIEAANNDDVAFFRKPLDISTFMDAISKIEKVRSINQLLLENESLKKKNKSLEILVDRFTLNVEEKR